MNDEELAAGLATALNRFVARVRREVLAVFRAGQRSGLICEHGEIDGHFYDDKHAREQMVWCIGSARETKEEIERKKKLKKWERGQ